MKWSGYEPIYDAGRAFVERALCNDDSLFTPGQPIWTAAACQEASERLSHDPDADGFAAKLSIQLEDAGPAIHQLMAEVLYVHFLIVDKGSISAAKKRENIQV